MGYDYVADTLGAAIEEWNHCVEGLKNKMQDKELVLQQLDKHADAGSLEEAMNEKENRAASLMPVLLKPTDANFL